VLPNVSTIMNDLDPCCHVHFMYIDDSISHSILTMICISCLILIDLVTEERITAIPLVAILPIATKPIFQVTPLLARSAAALKLTPALIQVDADANQVQRLFVNMRNPILVVLATDAPTLIFLL
jgi:hypothetical protein